MYPKGIQVVRKYRIVPVGDSEYKVQYKDRWFWHTVQKPYGWDWADSWFESKVKAKSWIDKDIATRKVRAIHLAQPIEEYP